MLGRKPNSKAEGQPERPKVYVRANGTRYVKVGDLLRSQKRPRCNQRFGQTLNQQETFYLIFRK